MNRLKQGFTLVELIVVIAVIGILAAITAVGMGRFQADTRDARRASSVTVISEALEKYYDENGEYPSCDDISSLSVTSDTLVGIDSATLVAPQAPASTANSLDCATLTIDGTDFFEYEGDGSNACNNDVACLSYSLKYKEEATGNILTLESRRNTSIATSGAPTLSLANNGYDSVDLSWTEVQNASSYLVQRSSSASFATVDQSYPVNSTATSTTATGLSTNTNYYFRVRPNATETTGAWSNVISVTTLQIATPVCTATAVSNSQINVGWGAVSGATSYTVEYSTSAGFSPKTTINGITGTSQSITSLDTGVEYFVRVMATNGSFDSSWCTDSATTFVPVPQNLTATTNSSTQITANWNSVSVADTYTLEYDNNSDFSSINGTISGITGTSQAATSLTQGERYYFRVYAYVGATSSEASDPANATTTVNTPSSPSITAYRPGAVRAYSSGGWIAWINSPASGNWYYAYANAGGSCPSGTSKKYQFSARYNSPSTTYTTGTITSTTRYMVQPSSGYKIKFGARMYCDGSDANSGWSSWRYSCAQNPGSTYTCNF